VSKYKLLLADDSITIQKVVNLTFADEGIEVISVGDGNSALAKFSEFTPDLVMADINMPGLNGYEICEHIKQNEQTRQIPVILLVGSFEPFDESKAQLVGADDYLTKPFQSIRQLVNKVSSLLESADKNSADDQSAASENESGEMQSATEENYRVQAASSEPLGDAGMDDEMIQANQAGFAAFDETQKYSSKSEFVDYAKTQPLSAGDLDQINSYQTASYNSEEAAIAGNFDQNEYSPADQSAEQNFENEENPPADEKGYQPGQYTAEEIQTSAESEPAYQNYQNKFANSPAASAADWELDEVNLLELPPRRVFSKQTENLPVREEEPQSPAETEEEPQEPTGETTGAVQSVETERVEETTATAAAAAENENPEEAEVTDYSMAEEYTPVSEQSAPDSISAAAPGPTNLSQADIDAIAQKVVERISDKVVRELAPQITDLIVRRMTEERLKE
jgi:CheY-like chemotaxis protein